MKSSRLVLALAAICFTGAAMPAFAQGRTYDRNASNNPEIYRQTHPEDAGAAQDLQGRSQVRPEPARPEGDRRGAREPDRRGDRNNNYGRNDRNDRRDYGRRDNGRRDNYNNGGWNLGFGFGVPPAYYYSPPPVYYTPPPVYYYGAPPVYSYSAPTVGLRPGDYLPREYLAYEYIVNDWSWRGLSAPPYGYHWVQVGNGAYALVVSNTGQIASVVAGR